MSEMKARIEKNCIKNKLSDDFSVFIFNFVVSKLQVLKFSKLFEINFLRLTLKEPILSKTNWVISIQIKNKCFQYFPNQLKNQKLQKNYALTKFLNCHSDF